MSSEDGKMFYGPIELIKTVFQYIMYVPPFPLTPRRHASEMLQWLESLPKIRNSNDYDEVIDFFQELVSFGQLLKVFFQVPNQQIESNINISTPNRNQVVATFINFLVLVVETILLFEEDSIACVKVLLQNLRTELGFLITFLGDMGMHLQPTKNIMIDIETMVNEVGNFLYSFFFTVVLFILIKENKTDNSVAVVDIEDMVDEVRNFLNSNLFTTLQDIPFRTTKVGGRKERKKHKGKKMKVKIKINALVYEVESFLGFFISTGNDQVPEIGILDLALSKNFPNFELLKTKIKEHCIIVSKVPSVIAPKTAVVSISLVDSVLDDLMHLINNESDRIVGVTDHFVMLHEELMLLSSSVTDVLMQQKAEHEDLLIRTTHVAYEVEYIINSFSPVWYLILRLPQLNEKIQRITMTIKERRNNNNAAGMTEVAKYPGEQVLLPSKEPPILENIIVGFDKVAIKITEQLVGGKKQLQIISIGGMPGLGKTTLANKLYNDPSVLCRFDKRAWCVVSQTCNKKTVLIDILSSIENQKRETLMNMENESLAEYLYKSLKGRRYLIVMDDIWDTESWDEFKRYFPDDGTGSRILFTTRNKEVGSKASSHTFIHALPFLSKVECWELLQLKVFKGKTCPQELLDIGKQIATNCHGLPLAVVVIAAILANKEKKENLWQQVAINTSLHLSENPENYIYILELSYKHLPMHLKPCFLYFGVFKEDMEIPVRKLIVLWVAEGYIKKEEENCLEEVALKYLMELIDRSLVLVVKRRSDGRVKTCKIHDLLHEMCLRIAEENNFLKVVKINSHSSVPFISQALVYQQYPRFTIYNGAYVMHSLPFGEHSSTLQFDCHEFPILLSCSFKVLKVSHYLENWDHHILLEIGHLFHLRYLSITATIWDRLLPSLDNFYRLEFLDVTNALALEVPAVLLRSMVNLRHVHFRGGVFFGPSYQGRDEIFQINKLQSCSVLLLSSEPAENFLRCSPNLCRLKAKVGYIFNYNFYFHNQLESLKLSWDIIFWNDSHFTLILPINLKKLTLVRFHASPEQMEIVGRLQYLEVLKLEGVVFKADQWDISEDEFPQLKFLKLDKMQIAEWNVSSDPFPRLERLVLQYCKHSKMIPSSFGDILTLEKIEVYGCAEAIKESAKKIQEEQQDIGKEVQVIILD